MKTGVLLGGIAIAFLSMAASAIACSSDTECMSGQVCEGGVCRDQTETACIDDLKCDDRNACNGEEKCDHYKCQPGSPLNCNDGNACTDDSCDPATGCSNVDNAVPCDDGNACTGTTASPDICSGGSCKAGEAVNCNDGNACTTDSCDTSSGCVFSPISCNDGNACTSDSCDTITGGCIHSPVNCDDGNACNGKETCDPAAGCRPGIPLACDDGNACNGVEICVSGSCQRGTPPVCYDEIACTEDSCDPAVGCVYKPLDADCDDGIACNGVETCDLWGGCQPGKPVVCTNKPCHQCVEPSGECKKVDLPPGDPHMMCGDVCVNTQNNDKFCGSCYPCDEGYKCQSGACVENPPRDEREKPTGVEI
jgi:hypothetical protein